MGASVFGADGEVGRDLAAVNWAATPLGDPAGWPQSLRTAVSILLSSRFSMWMAWGPELTFFCNAAYRRDTFGPAGPAPTGTCGPRCRGGRRRCRRTSAPVPTPSTSRTATTAGCSPRCAALRPAGRVAERSGRPVHRSEIAPDSPSAPKTDVPTKCPFARNHPGSGCATPNSASRSANFFTLTSATEGAEPSRSRVRCACAQRKRLGAGHAEGHSCGRTVALGCFSD